ncbi:MAG: hypothetical protein V7K40_24785 [Nostoc sp.]|uniref:hypothetical protein n=1 Tax=Nostoc sp. TaxID=1180 RepID=UPI002FFB237F
MRSLVHCQPQNLTIGKKNIISYTIALNHLTFDEYLLALLLRLPQAHQPSCMGDVYDGLRLRLTFKTTVATRLAMDGLCAVARSSTFMHGRSLLFSQKSIKFGQDD